MTTLTAPTLPTGPAGPYGARGGFDPAPARRRRNERLGLAGLLFGTSLLYMVNLGASGYANQFYAAAVQAGTKSWKAFFFGSFDSSNFITVDKPPMSLWPMELAGRLFGFNAWSMLLPQAIEGVLAVWLLYATVRRWFGPAAGLIAGAAMALTPVAVLMFRFNNPDALMTLLVVVAAYCVTRALEHASTRWLTLAGAAIGFSFLVKGLQPFTVVPALALAYAVAAPTRLRTRVLQLLAAAGGIVVGAGWWVLAVALTPAGSRPYIGGSTDNSALGLAFGYNGLGRLTGNQTGSGGGPGASFSGKTGAGRLFNSLNGGQISWLLPGALIALVALLAVTRRAGRTDRTRAAALLWGGWLIVTGGVLSFAGGIVHTYYTVELAPAIAALVGVGAVVLWRERRDAVARAGLLTAVLATGLWDYALLRRTPYWHPELGYLVLATSVVAIGALLVPVVISGANRRALIVLGVTGALSFGAGTAAYAVETAATSHNGGIPSAGPAVAGVGGFGAPGGGLSGRPGSRLAGGTAGEFAPPPQGGAGFAPPQGAGQQGGAGFAPPPGLGQQGRAGFARPPGTGQQGTGQRGSGRPGEATVSAAVRSLLKATTTTWAAATVGSQTAAPLELATGKAIMAIGGFNGSDPTPTLAQFEKLVQQGKVHYFIGGGAGGPGGGAGGPGGGAGGPGGGAGGPGGGGTGSQIATWVAANYSAKTVGSTTVYDLTQPTS